MAEVVDFAAPLTPAYASDRNLLLIAEDAAATADASEAVLLAGLRLGARVDFARAPARLAEQGNIDAVLVEAAGAPDAQLAAVLARVDTVAAERGIGVVVAFAADQLDLVAGQLLGGRSHLLCEPGIAERVAALALAAQPGVLRVRDIGRDTETARLQRLHEEVARIADTLARLTRGEEPFREEIRDPGRGYRAGSAGEPIEITAGEIRGAIRSRRIRNQFFEAELFADPAWDMLLDLFAAGLEHRRVSVSSLCIAAAVPPTTALRWIGTMHDAGLFERHADPVDRRRAYIALSDKGAEGMRGYVAAVKRAGLGIA